MTGVLLAIKSEFYVGLRSFSSKLIVLAPGIVAALQLSLARLREAGQESRDDLLGRGGFEDIAAGNAYGHFVDGLSTGFIILGLLLAALAAYSFSYDRDTGAVRHLLIRCVSRPAVVFAKLVYIHLLACLSLVVLVALSYLLSASFWEFTAIVEDGFELISEKEIWTEIKLGLQLAIIPIPAAICFGALISVATQSATQAVTTALGITLALDIFKSSLGGLANYLYASYQPSLLDQSYLKDVSRLVRGYSDVLVDERLLELNMWTPVPAMLIFAGLTLVIVQRIKL